MTARPTPDPENAARIGQGILDLFAGQPTEDCDLAVISALAVSIGATHYLGGGSLRSASDHVNALSKDIGTTILRDWGTLQRGDH